MKPQTLSVHYLPRGPRSRTRQLLEAFLAEVDPETIRETDLAEQPPPILDAVSLPGYVQRNYLGKELDPVEAASLARVDALTQQLLEADQLVLAFPMYNFSVPAAVKAWMDGVMQKNRTWTVEDGHYRGLLQGKRAIVLITAGAIYEGPRAEWDHASPLIRHALQFMGFEDIEILLADGMNGDPAVAEERLEQALNRARTIARTWQEPVAV